MEQDLKIYKNIESNLRVLTIYLKEIEKELLQNEINDDKHFRSWYNDFKQIYGTKYTNLKLYIIYSFLYFVGIVFVNNFILNNNKHPENYYFNNSKHQKVLNEFKIKYNDVNLFNFDYFTPIFRIEEFNAFKGMLRLVEKVVSSAIELENKEFFFDFLLQNIIASIIRHKSGEYYTPPFLVKQMVKEAYLFGEMVLDPCCGTGNFLIEIVKRIMNSNKPETEKISALNQIYGYDVNPMAIFFSKINLLFMLRENFSKVRLNLLTVDSLLQKERYPNSKFDLIIGNPPWFTYSDIESINYQETVKNLAEELNIKPLPKNILNIEISSLFFYQARNLYMKNNSKIFFVITKGVITGSHASRFRSFQGFKNVKIWTFDKKIEKLFNVDFICIYAQKSEEPINITEIIIPSYRFTLKDGECEISYFNDVKLELEIIESLRPYAIETKANRIYVKKFISIEKYKELLPITESHYKKLFHKGADLNPRNLIFVKSESIECNLIKINPDDRIFNKSKSPWTKVEFNDEIVEKKFLFQVIKSTELVKFNVFDYYTVFLPLLENDLSFKYNDLPKYAKEFYDKIDKIYIDLKKNTTKHQTLMENLNRWNKLINKRQLSEIKVVYNNSGSVLNSAVIKGKFLITGDLSFFDTSNIDEAFYLAAILNSNILNAQIKIKKSSRHIFKIPLETPIKRFDKNDENHQKLSKLGKEGHLISKTTVEEICKKKKIRFSKQKIQAILKERLKSILDEIDEILLTELKN